MRTRVLVFKLCLALLVAVPASAQAGWLDCFCFLSRKNCGPTAIVPPGYHGNAAANLKEVAVGAMVRIKIGEKSAEGIVLAADFDGITLGTMRNGKPVRKTFAHKKIDAVEPLGKAAEGELGAFGITETVAAVLNGRIAARNKYIEFLNTDYWAQIHDSAAAEVARLRELSSDQARKAYLRAEADSIMARVAAKLGAKNIGFHFNLNGGNGAGYVERGGLLISRGDVGLQYGMSTDIAEKIYFFHSAKVNLFDVLNSSNPKQLSGGRMGSELNIFSLDHPYFERAKAEGGISKVTDISFDFNPAWLSKLSVNTVGHGLVGIPYSTYLAPPVQVFQGVGKRFKDTLGKLSRDEETLVTMRHIEAVLLAEKSHL